MASLRRKLEPLAIAAARKYGVPPDVYIAMLEIESGDFSEDVVTGRRASKAGALGVAQFMPETAAELGIDPLDPVQAIDAGAKYLKRQIDYFGGDIVKGVAAYNAGAGNVDDALAAGGQNWFDYLPDETKAYIGAGARNYGRNTQVTTLPNTGSGGVSGLVLPVGNAKITQGFGPTDEKLDSGWAGHRNFNKGYDFAVLAGTPVAAAAGGTVIAAGEADDGWGTRVWVKDDDGNVHNYGHLSRANVQVGQRVEQGDVIALSGNSGASTGPHLSWDVWRETQQGPQYFDYLKERGGGGMVFDRTQGGGTATGGAARPGQIDTKTISDQITALTAALNDPELDPIERSQIAGELREWLQLQATGGSTISAYQSAQVGLQAQQQADARFQSDLTNLRNATLDEVAKGTLTLQEAVARINRFASGYKLANDQTNEDITNRVKLAQEAIPDEAKYHPGFGPGGLVNTVSQFSNFNPGVSGQIERRTIDDPATLRQQALQALGISGGMPEIANTPKPVFDPSTVQREPPINYLPPPPAATPDITQGELDDIFSRWSAGQVTTEPPPTTAPPTPDQLAPVPDTNTGDERSNMLAYAGLLVGTLGVLGAIKYLRGTGKFTEPEIEQWASQEDIRSRVPNPNEPIPQPPGNPPPSLLALPPGSERSAADFSAPVQPVTGFSDPRFAPLPGIIDAPPPIGPRDLPPPPPVGFNGQPHFPPLPGVIDAPPPLRPIQLPPIQRWFR